MKLNDKNIKNESNTTQAGVVAQLANTSIIAELLRKHYSDIQKTMVQEYLSNARDAHRELKLKHHLSVSLPTKRNPFFEVRDYGNKMDETRLFNNFNNYGDSTKRESNLETGGFGLGSKIAYAYTPVFFVIRYTGEEKITYQADCSKNVMGELKKLSSVKSKDPVGFCVKIPIKEQDFEKIKQSFYLTTFFWKNEQDIVIENFDKDEVNDDWLNRDYVEESDFYLAHTPLLKAIGTNYVVLDGIIYPIQSSLIKIPKDQSFNTKVLSLKFKTGDLIVAINREQLQVNEDNKKKIKDKIEKITNTHVLNAISNFLNKIKKQETKISFYDYFCNKLSEQSKYTNNLFLDIITNKISFKESNKKILYFKRSVSSWDDAHDNSLNLGLELLEGESLYNLRIVHMGDYLYKVASIKESQFVLDDRQIYAFTCSDLTKNLLHKDAVLSKCVDIKNANKKTELVVPLFKTTSIERFNKFCKYKLATSLGDIDQLINQSQEAYCLFLKKEEAKAEERKKVMESKARAQQEKEEQLKQQALLHFELNKDTIIFCKKAVWSQSKNFNEPKHIELKKSMLFIPDSKEWRTLIEDAASFSLFNVIAFNMNIVAVEQKYYEQITNNDSKLANFCVNHKLFVNKLMTMYANQAKNDLKIGKIELKQKIELELELANNICSFFNITFDFEEMKNEFKKLKKIINNDFLELNVSKRTKGALFLEMETNIIKRFSGLILKE
jgi:hypothetical protein